MATEVAGAHGHDEPDHLAPYLSPEAGRGIKGWLLTLDHKRIGLMYLVSTLLAFFMGGVFALLVRLELFAPGRTIMSAEYYNRAFTLHGAIMVFLFIIPAVPGALGNFVLPIMLGTKDVAFPRLNLLSFYVYLFGATGDHATVKRADNDSDATSSKVVGLVAAPIAQNENGVVITRGYVDGIDLSVGYTAGDILWLGEDGGFTKVKPTAPEHTVFLGVVVRATNNGIVYVAAQNGYELEELHDVKISGTPADGHVLTYNGADNLWRNQDPYLQTPVTTAWHYPIENLIGTYGNVFFGNATRVVFDTACSITDIGISLAVTFSGATTNTWRLGIYRDNGSNYPGALEVDAGTVTITTSATAGIKNITLGTPVSVAANEVIWLVISTCSNSSPTFPTMYAPVGHASPYRDNGVVGGYIPSAIGYNYGGASGTALPATFSSGANATGGGAPLVLVKVSVP